MKIGDFGSARVTFEGDPSNPLWEDAVTSGYISPELAWEDTFEEKTWELSNATNVSCASRKQRSVKNQNVQDSKANIEFRIRSGKLQGRS